MRARPPIADVAVIAAQIEATPGIDRVRALTEGFAAAAPDTVAAVLEEEARAALLAAQATGGADSLDTFAALIP